MQGAGRGRGAGETVELDWWEGRAEEQKRRAKYGFWDWKGEFIEGEVPPMYYSGELPGPA